MKRTNETLNEDVIRKQSNTDASARSDSGNQNNNKILFRATNPWNSRDSGVE